MKKPLKQSELMALAASHPPRDVFGPSSPYPYLAFDLDSPNIELAQWLEDLPCPVIGIGQGPLSASCDVVLENDTKLARLARNIENAQISAMVLVQHLRASETLSLKDTLTAESFAYAALQNGPDFKTWRADYSGGTLPQSDADDLIIETDNDTLTLTLNRPDTRNAIGTVMRDALCTALDLALVNDEVSHVKLKANGSAFSTGGAIEEFGEVSDPATAHWIRSLALPAWRLARLCEKLKVHINGAAIGAGIEMAAFGHHVSASPKAWFQLPELKYGLIPGAGGTASIPRRIGRQKTAYMALSMEKIRAETALDWGLIDKIVE